MILESWNEPRLSFLPNDTITEEFQTDQRKHVKGRVRN